MRETEKSEDIQEKQIMGQRFEISTYSFFIIAAKELNLSQKIIFNVDTNTTKSELPSRDFTLCYSEQQKL